MGLCSDAAMLLFYDIEGDSADHDEWHSAEHLHERLSIPGFLRATRWVAESGGPRYFILYEVSSLDVATSPDYLQRLNRPSAWTQSMMGRFRGMHRGFGSLAARAGFGFGDKARVLRFAPLEGRELEITAWMNEVALPGIASLKGMASLSLFKPAAARPMTKEQSLRGADRPLNWVLLASAYDSQVLEASITEAMNARIFQDCLTPSTLARTAYRLQFTASAQEALKNPRALRHAPAT